MTTYSIREFKARVSQILHDLDDGEEVIITRRGKPCGKLTAVPQPPAEKSELRSLRGIYRGHPPPRYLRGLSGNQESLGAAAVAGRERRC